MPMRIDGQAQYDDPYCPFEFYSLRQCPSQNALRPRVGPSWKRIICFIAALDLWTPIPGRRSEMTLCKAFFSRALYSEAEVRFWRRHKISVFRMPFTSHNFLTSRSPADGYLLLYCLVKR
jgi:hypothetical protein